MNDEDLHHLLRRADPARAVPPLTTARIHALTEHAMTTTAPPTNAPAARNGQRVRPMRVFLGAGLTLAAAATAALVVVPLLTGPAAPPTALKVPASTSGLDSACAPVSATFIRQADVALRGEVTGIRDGIVTIQVLHQYTGDLTQTVTIPQGESTAVDGAAPVFVTGGDYLIAASAQTVLTCGSTGADTPELRAIYDRAFAQ